LTSPRSSPPRTQTRAKAWLRLVRGEPATRPTHPAPAREAPSGLIRPARCRRDYFTRSDQQTQLRPPNPSRSPADLRKRPRHQRPLGTKRRRLAE